MTGQVWVLFLGSYSDRRAVAVFDNPRAAFIAAELLWKLETTKGHPEGVDLERLPLQSVGFPALLDGGTYVYSDGERYV